MTEYCTLTSITTNYEVVKLRKKLFADLETIACMDGMWINDTGENRDSIRNYRSILMEQYKKDCEVLEKMLEEEKNEE